MSNLNLKVLRSTCTDEWVSQTFSEYMMHCAEEKLKFMDQVTALCTNTVLEEIYDTAETNLIDIETQIDKRIFTEIINSNIDVDASTLSRDSNIYRGMFYILVNNPEGPSYDQDFVDLVHTINDELGYSSSVSATWIYNNVIIEPLSEQIVDSPVYTEELETQVTSLMNELGYSEDTIFSLNQGFVNMKELIKKVVINTEIDVSTMPITITALNSQDVSIGDISFSLSDFWNDAKANLASTIAWGQGFAAAAIDNISDRLSYFDANVKSMITDMGQRFTTSISSVKTMLSDKALSLQSFMVNAMDLLGWSALRDNQVVINDTDIMEYTGASPLQDVNLHTVKGIANAAVRTIVAIGIAAWNGVKALFKKVTPTLVQTVYTALGDAIDIKKISDSSSYTINNWCYQITDQIVVKKDDLTSSQQSLVKNVINGKLKKWIKISTIFGEILYRMTDLVDGGGWYHEGEPITGYVISYELLLKPRCMNFKNAISYLCHVTNGGSQDQYRRIQVLEGFDSPDTGISPDDFVSKVEAFKNSENIYADWEDASDDTWEWQMMMGFALGAQALINTISASWQEIWNTFTDIDHYVLDTYAVRYRQTSTGWVNNNSSHAYLNSLYTSDTYEQPSYTYNFVKATNGNFIKVCAGHHYYQNIHMFDVIPRMRVEDRQSSGDIIYFTDEVMWDLDRYTDFHLYYGPEFLLSMLMIWIDQAENPFDGVYYPYSANNINFDTPRFKIKTDTENANTANTFYEILVVVAFVAFSVLLVAGIAKIAKASKLARTARTVGMLDNKMWNGGKLTFAEKCRYMRKSKKLDKISNATAGLAAGSGVVDSLSDVKTKVIQLVGTDANLATSTESVADVPLLLDNEKTDWTIYSNLYKLISGYNLNESLT